MSGAAGSGMHGVQQRLDAMNLQRGHPTRDMEDGPRVIDGGNKFRKASNDSLDTPVRLEGWVIRRSEATKGKKLNWSWAPWTRMPLAHDDLLDQVKDQRKAGSVMDSFDALPKGQRVRVDELIDERNSSEQDPDAEWALASIKTKKQLVGAFGASTVTLRVYVILQRNVRPSSRHASTPRGRPGAANPVDFGQRAPHQGQDVQRPYPAGPGMSSGMREAAMQQQSREGAMPPQPREAGIHPAMREAAVQQQPREQAMAHAREPVIQLLNRDAAMHPQMRDQAMQQGREPVVQVPNNAAMHQQPRDQAMHQMREPVIQLPNRDTAMHPQMRPEAMQQGREPVVQVPPNPAMHQQMRDQAMQQSMHAAMRDGGMAGQGPQLRAGPQGPPQHAVPNMMHGGLGLGLGPEPGPRPGPGPGYGPSPDRQFQQDGPPPPPVPPAPPMYAPNQARPAVHPATRQSPPSPGIVQVPFMPSGRPDDRTGGKTPRHKASRHSIDPVEVLNGWDDSSSGSEEENTVFTDYESDSTRPTSHNGSDIKPPTRHRRKSSNNHVKPGTGRRHSVRDSSLREHRQHREHRRRGSHSRRPSRDEDELSDEVDRRPRLGHRRRSSVHESDYRIPSSLEETRLIDPRRRPLAGPDYGLSPRSPGLPELGRYDDFDDRVRRKSLHQSSLRLDDEAYFRREEARRREEAIREDIRREEAIREDIRREEAIREERRREELRRDEAIREDLRREELARREETRRLQERIRAEDARADPMRRGSALRRERSLHREDDYRGSLFRTSAEPTYPRAYSPPLSRGASRYY